MNLLTNCGIDFYPKKYIFATANFELDLLSNKLFKRPHIKQFKSTCAINKKEQIIWFYIFVISSFIIGF